MIHARSSSLQWLERAVVFAVHLRVVLHFEEHGVSVIHLSVEDFDRGQHALFPNGHRFVVETGLVHIKVRLAHIGLTLHQV